jgi:hypothetical protein
MFPFLFEHLHLGPLGTFSFLAADLLDPLLFFALLTLNLGFDLSGEDFPSKEPIDSLIPLSLAFYLDTGRKVLQVHTGRRFIDFLAAFAARTHKLLHDILLIDTQALHLPAESILFFFAHTGESQFIPQSSREALARRTAGHTAKASLSDHYPLNLQLFYHYRKHNGNTQDKTFNLSCESTKILL